MLLPQGSALSLACLIAGLAAANLGLLTFVIAHSAAAAVPVFPEIVHPWPGRLRALGRIYGVTLRTWSMCVGLLLLGLLGFHMGNILYCGFTSESPAYDLTATTYQVDSTRFSEVASAKVVPQSGVPILERAKGNAEELPTSEINTGTVVQIGDQSSFSKAANVVVASVLMFGIGATALTVFNASRAGVALLTAPPDIIFPQTRTPPEPRPIA